MGCLPQKFVDIGKIAARGAKRLDKICPLWYRLIDEENIHMSNPYKCIYGQLYGYYDVKELMKNLKLRSQREAVYFGFNTHYGQKYRIKTLAKCWKKEVLKRRQSL